MDWQNIDDFYRKPDAPVSKGDAVRLVVKVKGDFQAFESNLFGVRTILKHWIYQIPGKDVKPFELMDYSGGEDCFTATLKILRKSKEIDEFKLLCQDMTDVFNMEGIWITDWEVRREPALLG